ncbi:MAG TPA: MOSC domain-containing protein, partial [Streptosporangiaceae bacterium]
TAQGVNLAGDDQADRRVHGGPDKAIYAYASEDYDWWAATTGPLAPGTFGENLTTAGLDVTGALLGETWRLGGSVLVQVTAPRIPCVTFQAWLDEPQWVRRFAAAGRPGAYLRVLQPGTVAAGDPVEVVSRPAEAVTIAESMAAHYGDQELMRRVLRVPGRGEKWDTTGAGVLTRAPR